MLSSIRHFSIEGNPYTHLSDPYEFYTGRIQRSIINKVKQVQSISINTLQGFNKVVDVRVVVRLE